jgi:predicted Zn-dependent protease
VEQAEAIARSAPEQPDFPGLPEPAGAAQEAAYSEDTFYSSPGRRAAMASAACRLAREAGLEASGSVGTEGEEIAVANSRGVFAYTLRSAARMTVVAVGSSGSGHDADNAREIETIDAEAVAARAIAIGRRAQSPIALTPGNYTVILQAEAVADIAEWLAFAGFGARAVHEGRSFVAGKRGERVLGENISIVDDGLDPAGLPMPFDFEGMPRRRLSLIDRGIAEDIALDTLYAGKLGLPANGHAVPAGSQQMGPIPMHLRLASGTASVDDLVRSTERGLLVTTFHYTRLVHPLFLIVTGMTRHGTFLIEHGEVRQPVKNLRYTQSYVEALRDVQAIGSELRLVGEMIPVRVPALKIGSFAFTGVTE